MDGLTAAGLILSDNPDARIILLTQHNDPEIARICLKAGLLGYVLKTDLDYELSQAIHAASRGDFFVCRRIK
jgi:DNA-binding NarL/FixJ family response regulator